MRIGAISDIHANLPALEAVLDDMPAVDALVCAGDVIGYYPWPAEAVEAMQAREVPTVMGNHDRALVQETAFQFRGTARAGLEVARDALEQSHLDWLSSLPDDRVEFDGQVRIVHGHPLDPDRYTYPDEVDNDILMDEPVVILGHTHVQFHRHLDDGIVLNPGSVGQPRDGDRRAAYAVLDLDDMTVDEHRVEYNIDRVIEAVRNTDLPARLGERLLEGR